MISFIVDFVLFIMIGLFSLIFHELGHITAARLHHATKIYLTIGAGKEWFHCSIGRLELMVHRFFFTNFGTSSSREPLYTPKEITIISLMGPMYNFLLAAVFFVLVDAFFSLYVLYISFLFNMWLGIINLLPYKIGKKMTDGYIIYKALTGSK